MLLIMKLRSPGSYDYGKTAKGVRYSLVPDQNDLRGSCMLLTMDAVDRDFHKGGEDFDV